MEIRVEIKQDKFDDEETIAIDKAIKIVEKYCKNVGKVTTINTLRAAKCKIISKKAQVIINAVESTVPSRKN